MKHNKWLLWALGLPVWLVTATVALAQAPDVNVSRNNEVEFDFSRSFRIDQSELREIQRNAERTAREARRRVEDLRLSRGFNRDPANDELVEILGALRGDERASTLLIEKLNSSDDAALRRRIVDLLDRMRGNDEIINALANVALNDADDELAVDAIEAIADNETDTAVTSLSFIYGNVDSPARQAAAVKGLGDTEQEAAVPLVLGIYHSSEDESVRRAAVRALRNLDDYPAAVDGLLDILAERLSEQDA